jgi:hypothetical protein
MSGSGAGPLWLWEGAFAVYVSRLLFHASPGKTAQLEAALRVLQSMVTAAGGKRPRVLRTHFASLGAADVIFEQEVDELAELESEIHSVVAKDDFQSWSHSVSDLLTESPKREIYYMASGE